MDKKMEIILSMFDIRKLKFKCNYPKCENKPKKEILIYEQTVRRGKKNLASLYLCEKHFDKINKLITKLKKDYPAIIIDTKVIKLR